MLLKELLPATRATLTLAFLTGIVFPLLITLVAQGIFPYQANGSLTINSKGQVVGSALIGQAFSKPEYFHGRPSAAGSGYQGEASGGTNLGPTSSKLIIGAPDDPKTPKTDESFAGVKQLAEAYRKENLLAPNELIPVDAVTRSGSGLDPDISIQNAMLQVKRVATARTLSCETLSKLVNETAQERQFGFLGEARVNVLALNIALDSSTMK